MRETPLQSPEQLPLPLTSPPQATVRHRDIVVLLARLLLSAATRTPPAADAERHDDPR